LKEKTPEGFLYDVQTMGFFDEHEYVVSECDKALHLMFSWEDKQKKSELLTHKAYSLLQLDRIADAEESIDQALELNKGNALAHQVRAEILHDLERFDEALKTYQKCEEVMDWENIDDIEFSKADVLSHLGKHEEALEIYRKFLKVNESDVDAYWGVSDELSELGKNEEALEIVNKGLEIDEEDEELLNQKGVILLELKKFQEALDCFEKAIKSQPDVDLFWYNKACSLSLLNQKNEALDALLVATSIGPENLDELDEESDFDNIRNDERFKKILAKRV